MNLKKFLALAISLLSLIAYFNYSYAKTVEYFPGSNIDPKHLSVNELKLCGQYHFLLQTSQDIENNTGLLSEEFLETNKQLLKLSSDYLSNHCLGNSFFKEDLDNVKQSLWPSEADTPLTFYIFNFIKSHLNFPQYNGVSYNCVNNLFENKYFLADPFFSSLLGLTITNKSLIERSNWILKELGFKSDLDDIYLPDEQAVLKFKLHLYKSLPYYRTDSPLYNLDVKTAIILHHCLNLLEEKCFIDKQHWRALKNSNIKGLNTAK
ncbi:hypothetical protein MXE38_03115 [Anaerobiospirillum sp. NML120448]|uniref:hypothetical protein n=1 Tax=Anaerobiospirillum sp. NML120448 TaxID=2932816 RepID=UPI001FF27BB5|nr:hypothetical protein [Anaerobiospirillum sp. NML120448]MCK0513859.1 hypothetical protein [Anaerobiospirillum sp. NML120448]